MSQNQRNVILFFHDYKSSQVRNSYYLFHPIVLLHISFKDFHATWSYVRKNGNEVVAKDCQFIFTTIYEIFRARDSQNRQNFVNEPKSKKCNTVFPRLQIVAGPQQSLLVFCCAYAKSPAYTKSRAPFRRTLLINILGKNFLLSLSCLTLIILSYLSICKTGEKVFGLGLFILYYCVQRFSLCTRSF